MSSPLMIAQSVARIFGSQKVAAVIVALLRLRLLNDCRPAGNSPTEFSRSANIISVVIIIIITIGVLVGQK